MQTASRWEKLINKRRKYHFVRIKFNFQVWWCLMTFLILHIRVSKIFQNIRLVVARVVFGKSLPLPRGYQFKGLIEERGQAVVKINNNGLNRRTKVAASTASTKRRVHAGFKEAVRPFLRSLTGIPQFLIRRSVSETHGHDPLRAAITDGRHGFQTARFRNKRGAGNGGFLARDGFLARRLKAAFPMSPRLLQLRGMRGSPTFLLPPPPPPLIPILSSIFQPRSRRRDEDVVWPRIS